MPQGRGLGGGSTVNSAAALRGQPWCYDSWGVPGWGWDDVPARAERHRVRPAVRRPAPYHGQSGLIPITRLAPGPLDEAVFAWCDRRVPGDRGPRRAGRARPRHVDHQPPRRRPVGNLGRVAPAARAAGAVIRPDTTATRLVFDGTRCTGAETAPRRSTEVITADASSSAPARTARRNCCSGRASARETCSPRSASRRCPCWPESGPT